MTYRRKNSLRLAGYQYDTAGAYFITLVAHRRRREFSRIVDANVVLLRLGELIHEEWLATPSIRDYVIVHEDYFVVMPDHVHGVIWLLDNPALTLPLRAASTISSTSNGCKSDSISSIIGGIKSKVTKRWRHETGSEQAVVWQRSFYESIVRSNDHLRRIRGYIKANPKKWRG
jgi:putative transposase